MEHALAEERRAEADAVEAADQRPALVDLDRMRVTAREEFAIDAQDLGVDPGLVARRAAAHHGGEIAIGDDLEDVGAQGLGEAARDLEAVEREDAARFRLDPEQRLRLPGSPPSERARSNRP